MNNEFTNYIKKTKITVLIKSISFLLLIIFIILIGYEIIFLILIFIIIYIKANNERKKRIKYKIGADINNNIYIPLLLDNDYLQKISREFTNAIDIPANFKSLVSYVQYMINHNQMIFIKNNFKLDDIVNALNNLMKQQNINFAINKDDILKKDNDTIKLRRKDNIINDFHDLTLIRSILENNQLELIIFESIKGFSKLVRIDGYILAIIPITKVEIFQKYQIELANKLDYK